MISIEGHEYAPVSVTRSNGLIIHQALCSCGQSYDWADSQGQHERHVLDEQRKAALREVQEWIKTYSDAMARAAIGFSRETSSYIEGKEAALEAIRDHIEEALR